MTAGVNPTGFARKRLDEILFDVEQRAIEIFGPEIIQSAQSPLGQLNGLMADMIATAWEMAEDVYQANDPDQAEGLNLDRLASLRILRRGDEEADEAFRLAITNVGRARIDMQDITRAVRSLVGVSYAQTWINDTDFVDANGIASHSVAVAAIGGADDEIAATIREYVVPGVGSHGNLTVNATIEGFCRSISFVRPVEVPVYLNLNVRVRNDRNGCPPPAPGAIALALIASLTGEVRPLNGDDVTDHLIRSRLALIHSGIELVAISARRSLTDAAVIPLPISFFEIASFDLSRLFISVVP